jgi:DNA polymerase
MMAAIGLDESGVFITSPVHYFPGCGKIPLSLIEHGAIHIREQMKVIDPRLVVLLGNTACRAMLGTSIEIAKEHGTVIVKGRVPYLITFHPAYAMRFPRGRKSFIEDFAKLKTLLNGG